MADCELCHGPVDELARTSTQVWLGCPRCLHSWSVAAQGGRPSATDRTSIANARSTVPPFARGCLIAGLAVGTAFVIRIVLTPVLGSASPFLLFTPAVATAALYGGMFPGMLATALSTALGSHFFLAEDGEAVVERWDRIGLFLLVGAVITISISKLRRSRELIAASLWREQRARAMAEAADRGKEDFLALMSHELRTPLSLMLGWIALIRQRQMDIDAQERAFETIDRNARIMSRLVEDVLERSRLETGMLRLDRRQMSLSAIVRAAIEQTRPRLESQGLQCVVNLPVEDCVVLADSERLQQVFTNLLANAMKFTPGGGRISIDMTTSATDATVTVSDTGCGIAQELLPHVFEVFRQGQERQQRSSDGLGLGLSIVHGLVERHGGTIRVKSDGPRLGSAFTVTLPLAVRGQAATGLGDEPVSAGSVQPTGRSQSRGSRVPIAAPPPGPP